MKTIIGIILAGAVIVGGYVYIKQHPSNTEQVKTTEQSIPQETTTTPEKKMAFAQFVKQGGSYQCTVKQAVSDFDTTGTVFISKGNLRGQFDTLAEGKKINSYVLIRDGFTYLWSSMTPQNGIKIAVKTGEGDTNASGSGTYSWNAEQIGEYDCQPWVADEATFAVPSGITFTLIKQ